LTGRRTAVLTSAAGGGGSPADHPGRALHSPDRL